MDTSEAVIFRTVECCRLPDFGDRLPIDDSDANLVVDCGSERRIQPEVRDLEEPREAEEVDLLSLGEFVLERVP
jgi:hypothetical protein